MPKKLFHCQAIIHEGIKSISITDNEHHFCLTLDDAASRLDVLHEAIAAGRYPIVMELANSCPKLMAGAAKKYSVSEHDAKKFVHSLEKAMSH